MTDATNLQQTIDAGVQHHQAGRLKEAQALYEQVLAANPSHGDALHLMGLLMLRANRPQSAVDLIRRATTANPAVAQYHNSLGQALTASGATDEAMQAYRLALALKPDFPEAHNSLGIALRAAHKPEQAVEAFDEALRLRPDYADARMNLANALQMLGRWDDAIASYRLALALAPDSAPALSNLGNALQSEGQFDEAIQLHRKAVELQPDFVTAWGNLGAALQNSGDFEEARKATERALTLRPDWALAHNNLAINLLLMGEFRRGWEELEWRTRLPEGFRQTAGLPRWNGGDLKGRRILLIPEQGFGDVIHFARYASVLASQFHGNVILLCPPELLKLMGTLPGIEAAAQRVGDAPPADVEFPLLSLPYMLNTDLNTIPAEVPYLLADPQRSAKWRERLSEYGGVKVGMVWAGRPEYRNDRSRSMPLKVLDPLLALPEVQFVSLQKGPGAVQLRESPSRASVLDWTGELHDFADTAALIDNLDLVIAVDTAVAHLAGAMGKPVRVLLSPVLDWRWLLGRDDSPWYPTMKLLRQQTFGDWQPLVQSLATELSSWRK